MINKIKNFFTAEEKNKLAFSYTGILRFVPLIVAGGFFLSTILLVAFGPSDWDIHNNFEFYGFLIACVIALVTGYVLAVYKTSSAPRESMKINVSRLLLLCVAVALVLYFPTVKAGTGKWYPDVYTGITDTGYAYQMGKYYSQYAPKIIFHIRMLLAPFTMVVMPITFFYKSRLTKPAFWAGLTIILLNVALSISQGVTKQVADTAMQLVLFLVILMFSVKIKSKKFAVIHFTKFIAIILVICVSFFAYYSNAMKNRLSADAHMGQSGITNSSSPDKLTESIKDKESLKGEELDKVIDKYSDFDVAKDRENSIWNKILPAKFQPMFKYLISYFCHGYHGLSLSMEQEFTSSYGLGFSDFIRHNVSKFFGGEQFEQQMYQRTYMAKITAEGWPVGLYWATFFVYPASDISFIGTILLVFLIGFLFGLSWKDAILYGNPFALVSFFGFCTMVVYFSANNQMFQAGEQCIGFLVMIFLWLITRFVFVRKSRS